MARYSIGFLALVLSQMGIAGVLIANRYEVPEATKKKYAYLYDLKTQSLPGGVLGFHQGTLQNIKGINVLHLKGDRFEMAFQHARLMKEQIHDGALLQASKMLERAVRGSMPSIPGLTDLAVEKVYGMITDPMYDFTMKQFPQDSKDAIIDDSYGLSEGSGIALKDVVYGAFGPESVMVLLGEISKKTALRDSFAWRGLGGSSCSAFTAWGSRTTDGEMIIGRNTDYPLNGSYDRYPTVFYYEPKVGQKFMSVISAGLHLAGVLGYNESGIYLGVHTQPSHDTSTKGTPSFLIAQDVLANARTMDEVIARFKRFRSGSGWGFMVVSTKEKKVASIEVSNQHVSVRQSTGDFHVQTNHTLTPEASENYFAVNVSTDDDTRARFDRITGILNQAHGSIDEREAMGILADKFDSQNQKVKGLGNTVAVHTTMTSVVLRPEKGVLYVANGTAPVSLNEYVELPLIGSAAEQKMDWNHPNSIAVPRPSALPANLLLAEQVYIKAKMAFEFDLDSAKAHELLKEVVELDPENPGYRFSSAAIALKTGDEESAKIHLEKMTQISEAHYQLMGHYFLGRMAGAKWQKAKALEHLDYVLKNATSKEAMLIKSAQESSKTIRFWGHQAFDGKKLSLQMQQADLLSY